MQNPITGLNFRATARWQIDVQNKPIPLPVFRIQSDRDRSGQGYTFRDLIPLSLRQWIFRNSSDVFFFVPLSTDSSIPATLIETNGIKPKCKSMPRVGFFQGYLFGIHTYVCTRVINVQRLVDLAVRLSKGWVICVWCVVIQAPFRPLLKLINLVNDRVTNLEQNPNECPWTFRSS